MIRALLWRNLRQHALLLSVLFLSLVLLEFFLAWVAAEMDIGPEFQSFLQTFLPPEITAVIFSQFGLTSFQGALAFGYQHPFSLVATIAMVIVAATLPAAEKERGYLELFLAYPVPRSRYLLSITLFVGMVALVLPLGLLLGTGVGLRAVDYPSDVGWGAYIPSALALALLLMAVGAYTLLFATRARRRGVAVAQGVGFTLLFYWMDFMGAYWDTLDQAKKASPFFYFDPAQASLGAGISSTETLVLGSIILISLAVAFFNFQREEL